MSVPVIPSYLERGISGYDETDCLQQCLIYNTQYGALLEQNNYMYSQCICGNLVTFKKTSCACPDLGSGSEPVAGSLLCDLVYVPKAAPVSSHIGIQVQQPGSTLENLVLEISTDLDPDFYHWSIQTEYSTSEIETSQGLLHGLLPLNGVYNLQVRLQKFTETYIYMYLLKDRNK